MQGVVLSENDIYQEFQNRFEQIKAAKEEELRRQKLRKSKKKSG
jgi:hypothetical protein